MKLNFYQSPMHPFGSMIFYEYDKKKDERYYCNVITKIYYDKPFSFETMSKENVLVSLFDLSKSFDNELTLKNWLIDNSYQKLFGNDEYEIYTSSLRYISRLDMKIDYSIPVYAVFMKKDTPPQNTMEAPEYATNTSGTQPTDVQQLNVALALLKDMVNVLDAHGIIHKDSGIIKELMRP